MEITEQARQRLRRHLEEVLGEEGATALMDQFPPGGWADVATKHDVVALRDQMDRRFEALEGRMDARFETMEARLDARWERELRLLEQRSLTRLALLLGVFFTIQTAVTQALGS